jgi:hypothetical protein
MEDDAGAVPAIPDRLLSLSLSLSLSVFTPVVSLKP